MSERYTGSIEAFRRPQLLQIVQDLSIDNLPPGYLPKDNLVEIVRTRLITNPQQRQDPRFQGLWWKMDEGESDRLVESNGATEEIDQEQFKEDSSRKSLDQLYHEQDRRSTRSHSTRSSTSPNGSENRQGGGEPLPPSSLREAIMNPHIFDTLLHSSPSKGVQELVNQAIEVVEENTNLNLNDSMALVPVSRSLRRKSSQNLRAVARGTGTMVAKTQKTLSNTWVFVLIIVALELSWITFESIPWVEFSFGPIESLILPHVPQTLYSIPGVHLVIHPLFILALLRWSTTTLVVPFLLSFLFPFPNNNHNSSSSSQHLSPSSSDSTEIVTRSRSNERQHEQQSQRQRQQQNNKISSPSPLIFSLFRLSLALLRGYVLPFTPTSQQPLHSIAQHTALSTLKNLKHFLREVSITSQGGPGLTGWRELLLLRESTRGMKNWGIEGTVGGVWGVVAIGMGVCVVVCAVERNGRR